jgi:hypothetical protein
LLSRGFSPTPVVGKKPIMPEWQKNHPTAAEIEAWERDYPQCQSTGVVCGKVNFIDVDVLDAAAVDEIESAVRRRFGSRGKILVRSGKSPKVAIPFRAAAPFRLITYLFDPPGGGKREQIECRAADCMVVIDGIHPETGQPYTTRDRPLWEVQASELPELTEDEFRQFMDECAAVLVEHGYTLVLQHVHEGGPRQRAADELRPPEAAERVKAVLDVIPAEDYRVWLEVGCALVTVEGYSPDVDWEEIWHWWSARCPEKYDHGAAAAKWADLKQHEYPFTIRTLFFYAMKFNPGWTPPRPDDDAIARLNEDHAFLLAGDKAVIMKFEGRSFRLLKKEAFKYWHANKGGVWVTENKFLTHAQMWLTHPKRREYGGIEFAPGGMSIPANYYNLWRGFTVEPRGEGDCSLFLAHVRDNIAQGHADRYRWIVGWFAQIVQQPHVKIGTALVLRGKQGVGKTKVGEVIGSLLGDHYDLVSDPRYITGQFNSHMASLLLLHADEAFWAGDKRSEGKLKDMVTGFKHRLEF